MGGQGRRSRRHRDGNGRTLRRRRQLFDGHRRGYPERGVAEHDPVGVHDGTRERARAAGAGGVGRGEFDGGGNGSGSRAPDGVHARAARNGRGTRERLVPGSRKRGVHAGCGACGRRGKHEDGSLHMRLFRGGEHGGREGGRCPGGNGVRHMGSGSHRP